jgi:nitrogen-specific signal transduction histidine kinase/ActR/RegA family two-component response regulator
MVISLEDITERNRAEENRHRVDKLESVGLLAGGIAHDFNNLLTGIMGSISCAKLGLNPEEKPFKYLITAEIASLRAAELTQQLLTFARGGAPVKKRTAVGRLVRESTGFAVRGTPVNCVCQVQDDLWPCEVDEGQINQVLNNLIINAVQAMPGGGGITVTCANLVLAGEASVYLPPGTYVRITIQDTGAGIPKEHLAKIFNPYFTTKKAGNGLGLATASSIIKKHEGAITVVSEPGQGTTFTLYLPAVDAVEEPEVQAAPPVLPGTGRILVMDDEPHVLEIATAMLECLGYACATARDGAEAVALYRQAAAGQAPFAAVIMDLTIPGGMGGKEALARLLDQAPEVRAIVSSGYSDSAVMAEFATFGFQGVLSKPYRIEDLSSVLTRVLGSQAPKAVATARS